MLRASKSFSKKDENENENEKLEADLIEICNKSVDSKEPRIVRREMVLKHREILKIFKDKDFRPYSGLVESEDEAKIYREMLDKHYPLLLTPAPITDNASTENVIKIGRICVDCSII
jgi:hypothetical protein